MPSFLDPGPWQGVAAGKPWDQDIICHEWPRFLIRTQEITGLTLIGVTRNPINAKAPLTRIAESDQGGSISHTQSALTRELSVPGLHRGLVKPVAEVTPAPQACGNDKATGRFFHTDALAMESAGV